MLKRGSTDPPSLWIIQHLEAQEVDASNKPQILSWNGAWWKLISRLCFQAYKLFASCFKCCQPVKVLTLNCAFVLRTDCRYSILSNPWRLMCFIGAQFVSFLFCCCRNVAFITINFDNDLSLQALFLTCQHSSIRFMIFPLVKEKNMISLRNRQRNKKETFSIRPWKQGHLEMRNYFDHDQE